MNHAFAFPSEASRHFTDLEMLIGRVGWLHTQMVYPSRGGDYRGDGGTRPPNILVGEELKGFCIIKIQFFQLQGGYAP